VCLFSWRRATPFRTPWKEREHVGPEAKENTDRHLLCGLWGTDLGKVERGKAARGRGKNKVGGGEGTRTDSNVEKATSIAG